MLGVLFAIIGGALITLQGTFNAKLSADIGLWSTSVITHLIGFLLAFFIFIIKKEPFIKLKGKKLFYLTGGIFGAFIVFSETYSISFIGITLTIGILMIAQLLSGFIVEILGLFGIKKIKIKPHHLIGCLFMIGGIMIYNFL